ncbi:MAG: AbrB/MazE/SpoVT family DNA-binding domain-containing protein [Thermoprotei archaeon]|nr:AbrB/MazE/SpoVT family DNA-binding domain-containing protein [Thermoprotei archaeon]
MVKLRIKVGPKGQIVIPKIFREAYRIREGGYVILEPADDKLILRGIEDPRDVLMWIRERKKRIGGKEARLGDLAKIDLEEEFEE